MKTEAQMTLEVSIKYLNQYTVELIHELSRLEPLTSQSAMCVAASIKGLLTFMEEQNEQLN